MDSSSILVNYVTILDCYVHLDAFVFGLDVFEFESKKSPAGD